MSNDSILDWGKIRKISLKFLSRYIILSIFILLVAIISTLIYNQNPIRTEDYSNIEFDWSYDPRGLEPFDDSFGPYNVFLDGHSHTVYSDGRLTPEQLVKYSIANGYNALVVSDHNTVEGALKAMEYVEKHHKGEIVIIPGQEYSSCRIHMNLIGINETIPASPAFPTNEDLKNVVDKVHELGGLVIVNHIPWSNRTNVPFSQGTLPNHPSLEELEEIGVDGFEVINQDTFDLPTFQYIKQNPGRFFMITGSDTHFPTTPYAWTLLKTSNLTIEAILEQLRAQNTTFAFNPTGIRPRAEVPMSSQYQMRAPLLSIAELFQTYYDRQRGMYSFQYSFCEEERFHVHSLMIPFFFLYLLVLLILYELFYYGIIQAIHLVRMTFAKRNNAVYL